MRHRELARHRRTVEVRKDRPAAAGETQGIDQAGVVLRVREDAVGRADERGDQPRFA